MTEKTLFDKIWEAHIVHERDDGTCLIYIDRHLTHEVTSPQAFEGLSLAKRKVRQPKRTIAVPDHNVPTTSDRLELIEDEESRIQLDTLKKNVELFNVPYIPMEDVRQGIVHIIGPEQGLTQPGMTVVCGDSHTATHGAFGALAFGIGTSEVEHVLATQTLPMKRPQNMRITIEGELGIGVEPKDLILAIIGEIGTAGGTGHVIEYTGHAIKSLTMEGRMTVCNMTIEAGARAGLIAPDEKTFEYVKGRPMAPKSENWEKAINYWSSLPSDPSATYDRERVINASNIAPQVTWGTSPEDVVAIDQFVPDPNEESNLAKKQAMERAIEYMGLKPGMKMTDIEINKVFIGSCTNARIEDLRNAAQIIDGNKISNNVKAIVVPGSGLVKKQAEDEGLDKIFLSAGWEWREAGCSMCIGMNPDKVNSKERCASTSNRNFEGRQGDNARTHLVSPAMAAAASITGKLTDIRKF
ncbi:MAG: 3-isopropylmalate dehydratase large subunit [Alphaproteobacteria bacterium MarineAlpha2_Bin1]|nr:MAG: 3-isopropylmalate dehydratase large subunit [Alphaproteobacteria bacterium MarineAlpha2_Bin1]